MHNAWQSEAREQRERQEEANVDQPHHALYAMENLFIILRVSLLLFAGRRRTPIGLPTTPACLHPTAPNNATPDTAEQTPNAHRPNAEPEASAMCCCRTILRFPFEVVSLCQFYFAV